MATAPGDLVHVVWLEFPNTGTAPSTTVRYNRSLDGGRTWPTTSTRIDSSSAPPAQTFSPQLAVSGSSVCVAWTNRRNGPNDVFFNCSADNGQTWPPSDRRVSTAVAGQFSAASPRLAMSRSIVHVLWADDRSGRSEIFARRSTDFGATWAGPEQMIGVGASPEIAVVGTSVFATWFDGADVWFSRSSDDGTTWSPAIRIDSDRTNRVFQPKIAAAGSNVYITWLDQNGGNTFILFNRSTDAGANWEPIDQRITAPVPILGPGTPLMRAAGSAVFLAWRDTRDGGPNDIYFNRSLDTGITWLTNDVRINTDARGLGSANLLDLAVSGSNVHAIWDDSRGGFLAGQLRYNRSSDTGATWRSADLPFGEIGARLGAVNANLALSDTSVRAVSTGGGSISLESVQFSIILGAEAYGSGTPGTAGAPTLTMSGAPLLGSSIDVRIGSARPAATATLLLGVGPSSRVASPLLGGTLLTRPDLAVPLTISANGTTSIPLSLPNSSSLQRANVNFQSIVADPGAAQGLAMSNGLEAWFN